MPLFNLVIWVSSRTRLMVAGLIGKPRCRWRSWSLRSASQCRSRGDSDQVRSMWHPAKWLGSFLLLITLSAWSQTEPANNPSQSGDNVSAASLNVLPDAPDKVDPAERGLLPPGEDPQNRLLLPFVKHLAGDQVQFWTTPRTWTKDDARTVIPFAGFTGALIAGDSWISRQD